MSKRETENTLQSTDEVNKIKNKDKNKIFIGVAGESSDACQSVGSLKIGKWIVEYKHQSKAGFKISLSYSTKSGIRVTAFGVGEKLVGKTVPSRSSFSPSLITFISSIPSIPFELELVAFELVSSSNVGCAEILEKRIHEFERKSFKMSRSQLSMEYDHDHHYNPPKQVSTMISDSSRRRESRSKVLTINLIVLAHFPYSIADLHSVKHKNNELR
ncbi:hypothetical protein Scep_009539 [Stephania cephalantha]|uniref:Uncharacterized protein n=1 Tax=Stephania cephalantha TaxID=152367 RepID=A0AAP0JTC9_9MAGN